MFFNICWNIASSFGTSVLMRKMHDFDDKRVRDLNLDIIINEDEDNSRHISYTQNQMEKDLLRQRGNGECFVKLSNVFMQHFSLVSEQMICIYVVMEKALSVNWWSTLLSFGVKSLVICVSVTSSFFLELMHAKYNANFDISIKRRWWRKINRHIGDILQIIYVVSIGIIFFKGNLLYAIPSAIGYGMGYLNKKKIFTL